MKKILSILFLVTVFVAGASAQQLEKLFEKLRTSPRGNHATAKELADLHGIVTEHAKQTQKVIEAIQQQIRDVVDVRNSVGSGI